MSRPNIQNQFQKSTNAKAIFRSGLLVGTLDILAAIVLTSIRGSAPTKMLQYIASGVFGNEAFSGGLSFAFLGLLFHYLIAFVWTIVFFKLYPKVKKKVKSNVLIGFLFGSVVWIIMNLIVLPLSNVPQGPFHIASAITGILVLIAAIGIPLSFMARKYFDVADDSSKSQNHKKF